MGIGVFGCIKSVECRFKMRIPILCLVICVYVVYASEEIDSSESVAKHMMYESQHEYGNERMVPPHNQHVPMVPHQQPSQHVPMVQHQQPIYHSPMVQPQPIYQQPIVQHSPVYYGPAVEPEQGGLLDNPLLLIVLLMSMTRTTTTTAATTTLAPGTTTANPLAGWTQVGDDNCYYLLSTDTLNWDEAKAKCEETENAGLAVIGFNAPSAERLALIQALGAEGATFWIGVDGAVDSTTTTIANPAEFIAPLDGVDVTAATPGFTTEIFDSSAADAAVCGRVDATDVNLLQFEACGANDRRYICEICI